MAELATGGRIFGPGSENTARLLAVRRRILVVAKHKFARQGYAGVSLTDLGRAADVSSHDLQVHFTHKDAVLDAVLDEGWRALGPRLAEVVFGIPNARMGMLALLTLVANVLQEDEDWVRLVLFEGRRPDADSGEMHVSAGYRKFKHICMELVMRGQKEGIFRPEFHPQVVASVLVGAIEGILRDKLLAEEQYPITPYSGSYLLTVFDGLVSYLGLQQSTPSRTSPTVPGRQP